MDRRWFLLTLAATPLAFARAEAANKKFVLAEEYMPQLVDVDADVAIGTILIDPAKRFLYLVEATGVARRYGIGVGRTGLAFKGT
ncbi:MAG: hypothetical protein KGZ68_18395, partial [Dechloromonas sp.]|nr:hypothetical protein [Dechloromonas sp.]